MNDGRRLRLGLYVLFAGTLFVALLGFIAQSSLGRASATFFILFEENVKGMVIGSKVNFQGVPIGVVVDMRFRNGKTLVELQVDPTRAGIQDVTRARMDRLLVTGQVTVELEGYSGDGRPLPDGAFIATKDDPLNSLMKTSLPEVVAQASVVLTRLERVLANSEQLLGEDNRRQVANILANAERASAHLADATVQQLDGVLVAAQRTLAAAESTATRANDSVAQLDAALQALPRLEADLHTLLVETTAVVTGVRGPTLAAFSGLRSTLDDLRGLLRQLKLAPDSLLFGVERPAAPTGGGR